MKVQPYLVFNGRCEEALEFYKRALGAEVSTLMRFKESPDQSMVAKGTEDKVMHCEFRIGTATILASDGECNGKGQPVGGFSLAITAADPAEAERVFNRLGDNGTVNMPLTKTFFAERFGIVADKFGVPWMIVTEK